MTRHSTLNNANDLHYAKARIFTGHHSTISADFVDQILISEDTNIAYRAIGISQGELIGVSSNDNGNGNGNGISSMVGVGYPNNLPIAEGQSYFDLQNKIHYISVARNGLEWFSDIPDIKITAFAENFTNLFSFGGDGTLGTFSVFHSYLKSTEIPSSLDLQSLERISGSFDNISFEQLINQKSYGLFFFGMEILDPNNVINSVQIGVNSNHQQDLEGAIDIIDLNNFSITDGFAQNVSCLSIEPYRRLRATLGLEISIFSIS